VTVDFQPGDVLLLLSDGFYEYADARGEQFGEARVRDLVAAGHGATASELLALVQKAVDAFAAGAAQEDDMTAVVVRRIASP
jgi:serine phosphatase RsbU (regulator of sigma subunit)